MRLNLKSFVLAWTILWAGCVLVTGLANLVWNDYGQAFLELCSSFYPGYQVTHTIGSVVVGTLYAIVDGAIGGLVFAWLYNRFTPAS